MEHKSPAARDWRRKRRKSQPQQLKVVLSLLRLPSSRSPNSMWKQNLKTHSFLRRKKQLPMQQIQVRISSLGSEKKGGFCSDILESALSQLDIFEITKPNWIKVELHCLYFCACVCVDKDAVFGFYQTLLNNLDLIIIFPWNIPNT